MSHADDVQRYIDGVLDGSIRTGRLERLAVHRHVADLELAGERGFYFDESKAILAIDFSKFCVQFEGDFAGKVLELRIEQKFVWWCVFGWRQTSDGMRRFRQVQYEKARKGGKSTEAAYISCLLMFADSPIEKGAQGYVAATKQSQAKIVWYAAMKMIQRSPALKKHAKITESELKIEVPRHDNRFFPLSSDKTPDGFNPHFIIKDEEHAWGENHRGQADTLGSGFGARSQPITITITTYGDDSSTLWQENHDYAVRCVESVISGEIVDDTWFVFICATDFPNAQPCFQCKGDDCPWCDGSGVIPADDPYDERNWRKANPGIGFGKGFTPRLERMRDLANVAKQRPDKESEFFQKNLNIIVCSRSKVVTAEAWQLCRVEKLADFRTADRVHGGGDLGRSNDMCGAAVVARWDMTDDNGVDFQRFEIRSRAWTCKDRHDDVKTPQVANWVANGKLEECDGDQVLFSEVAEWAVAQTTEHGVITWAYDPDFGPMFGQTLKDTHALTVFPFPQKPFKYNNVTRRLIGLLTEVHMVECVPVRAIGHDGDPVLAWMMTNLIVVKNSRDQWMPDKGASPQKIDIAVAVLMAISECLYSDEDSGKSVYATRGILDLSGEPAGESETNGVTVPQERYDDLGDDDDWN